MELLERLELDIQESLGRATILMPDLRTWLNEVDKFGQLMTVDNVHWDLELSTLIINERPAILFDRIKVYPEGYRVAARFLHGAPGPHASHGGQTE